MTQEEELDAQAEALGAECTDKDFWERIKDLSLRHKMIALQTAHELEIVKTGYRDPSSTIIGSAAFTLFCKQLKKAEFNWDSFDEWLGSRERR